MISDYYNNVLVSTDNPTDTLITGIREPLRWWHYYNRYNTQLNIFNIYMLVVATCNKPFRY